jgi:CheY-like chemotaxis protein
MKILLIDDNSDKGWKQIIEKIFPVQNIIVEVAIDSKEAIIKLDEKYDMIFLDVRLSELDQRVFDPTGFSGYKILKEIKRDFLNVNFSTPIILVTASNKIWNIDAFIEYGVDGYYIKEHPDYVFDKETSKQNYNNLKRSFIKLRDSGDRREAVWLLSKAILEQITQHSYFNDADRGVNVKLRIEDKLKLGYEYLFRSPNKLGIEVLKTNNEAIAFIIYWSILEEIVKGCSAPDNWTLKSYEFTGNWRFRNKEYYIESFSEVVKLSIKRVNKTWIRGEFEFTKEAIDEKYMRGEIVLSEQVHALIAAYAGTEADFEEIARKFREINAFRNRIDFIHSRIQNIYEKPLIEKKESEKQYDYCIEQLKFINRILSII